MDLPLSRSWPKAYTKHAYVSETPRFLSRPPALCPSKDSRLIGRSVHVPAPNALGSVVVPSVHNQHWTQRHLTEAASVSVLDVRRYDWIARTGRRSRPDDPESARLTAYVAGVRCIWAFAAARAQLTYVAHVRAPHEGPPKLEALRGEPSETTSTGFGIDVKLCSSLRGSLLANASVHCQCALLVSRRGHG